MQATITNLKSVALFLLVVCLANPAWADKTAKGQKLSPSELRKEAKEHCYKSLKEKKSKKSLSRNKVGSTSRTY